MTHKLKITVSSVEALVTHHCHHFSISTRYYCAFNWQYPCTVIIHEAILHFEKSRLSAVSKIWKTTCQRSSYCWEEADKKRRKNELAMSRCAHSKKENYTKIYQMQRCYDIYLAFGLKLKKFPWLSSTIYIICSK